MMTAVFAVLAFTAIIPQPALAQSTIPQSRD